VPKRNLKRGTRTPSNLAVGAASFRSKKAGQRKLREKGDNSARGKTRMSVYQPTRTKTIGEQVHRSVRTRMSNTSKKRKGRAAIFWKGKRVLYLTGP